MGLYDQEFMGVEFAVAQGPVRKLPPLEKADNYLPKRPWIIDHVRSKGNCLVFTLHGLTNGLLNICLQFNFGRALVG